MTDRQRRRDRYLRDPLPIRLGSLATSLARIASSARHGTGATAVATMIEECRWYIEWTAADTAPEVASELVDIQRLLTLWRGAWPTAQLEPKQRILLSVQAKKWADQVLDYSGLLERV